MSFSFHALSSFTKKGKLVTNPWDVASFCPTNLPAGLAFCARSPAANCLTIAGLCCPRIGLCSPQIVRTAQSRCAAAVSAEEMIMAKMSAVTFCSAGCWESILLIREGSTRCRKMGNSGGVWEDLGVAKTNVASRLTIAISLMLPDIIISDQRIFKNFVGGEMRKHFSTFKLGTFCPEAAVIASCTSCFGCSSQLWRLTGTTRLVSGVKIRI